MKILITIPNTKPSSRFPNKNKILASRTVEWLEEELANYFPHNENMEIVIKEIISDFTIAPVTPYPKYHVSVYDCSNHEKILSDCHYSELPDFHIHLQLTNYNRRHGLLIDAIQHLMTNNNDVVSSYCSWFDDYSWRELDTNGMFCDSFRTNREHNYYDGAIYCFREPEKVFDK